MLIVSSLLPPPTTVNLYQRAGRLVALCMLSVVCSLDVAAQPTYSLPALFESRGSVSMTDIEAPGLAEQRAEPEVTATDVEVRADPHAARGRGGTHLDGAQRQALARVLRRGRAHGAHDGDRRGRHLGHRLVRFPTDLAGSEGFVLGYGPNGGLSDNPRVPGDTWLLAVRDDLAVADDDGYAWSGSLYLEGRLDRRVGTAVFGYQKRSGVTGTIQIRGDLYTIEPIGRGLHALVNVDEGLFPQEGGSIYQDGGVGSSAAVAVAPLMSPAPPRPAVERAGAPSEPALSNGTAMGVNTATILVLWTDSAAVAVTDINATALVAFQLSNSIYANSEAAPRLSLRHRQLLAGFSEGDNIVIDVDERLPAAAGALREQYDADLVILLTGEHAYGENVCGQARDIFTPGSTTSEDAYAIVDVSCAIDNKSFTHEIGHLQGARHHPDDDAACQGTGCDRGFSYGRGHRDKWGECFWFLCGYNRHSTVMSRPYPYGINGEHFPRIPYFSNPDVDVEDRTTGIAGERDNAAVLDLTATDVGLFRVSPISASIVQTGTNGTYTFHASGPGGSSGRSYKWYVSFGQPGNYQLVSTAFSFTQEFPLGTSYVKLIVTAGPGETSIAYRTVVFTEQTLCERKPWLPECDGEFLQVDPQASALRAAPHAPLAVGPNPASSEARVTYTISEASRVVVDVFDAQGRQVAQVAEAQVEAGAQAFDLDTSTYPTGTYVVRLTAGGRVETARLTVVR